MKQFVHFLYLGRVHSTPPTGVLNTNEWNEVCPLIEIIDPLK